MAVNLDGFGFCESVDITTAKTLAITDVGVVQNATVSATHVLPSTVVGYVFILRIGRSGITVNLSPAAVDKIAGNGFTALDDKDLIFTNQPVGSYVILIGDGVNGWFVSRISGTATRET